MPWGSKRLICSTRRPGQGARLSPSTTRQPRNRGQIVNQQRPHLESKQNAAEEQRAGLTLEQYARAKGLPVKFLESLGLTEFTYDGKPALRIPYRGTAGEELAVRFRIALEGDRFRWKAGANRPLWPQTVSPRRGRPACVVLVEGESDCHTLWHHGIPALGIPGAANWREERDAHHLDGIETIYVVIEPDRGGKPSRMAVAVFDPPPGRTAQPAGRRTRRRCICRIQTTFKEAWTMALPGRGAVDGCRGRDAGRGTIGGLGAMRGPCATGETSSRAFDAELRRLGVVGERRLAKLLYLAVTSRLLDRPVSVAVKGPSSGGKSFVVESVAEVLPAGGLSRAHGDERPGAGLFDRAAAAPPSWSSTRRPACPATSPPI